MRLDRVRRVSKVIAMALGCLLGAPARCDGLLATHHRGPPRMRLLPGVSLAGALAA